MRPTTRDERHHNNLKVRGLTPLSVSHSFSANRGLSDIPAIPAGVSFRYPIRFLPIAGELLGEPSRSAPSGHTWL
jgi:hypothetical protein